VDAVSRIPASKRADYGLVPSEQELFLDQQLRAAIWLLEGYRWRYLSFWTNVSWGRWMCQTFDCFPLARPSVRP
jgi:hypothetical protein